jgi:hypothetical protein
MKSLNLSKIELPTPATITVAESFFRDSMQAEKKRIEERQKQVQERISELRKARMLRGWRRARRRTWSE